jgi:hypothetical protein
MASESKRKRDYAKEYLIRIARGLAGGKSRSQARGHVFLFVVSFALRHLALPGASGRPLPKRVCARRRSRGNQASSCRPVCTTAGLRSLRTASKYSNARFDLSGRNVSCKFPRMPLTPKQVIEELAKTGRHVEARTLTDWRNRGLLPKLTERGQGHGRGKAYFWTDPDILDRVALVADLPSWETDRTILALWSWGFEGDR